MTTSLKKMQRCENEKCRKLFPADDAVWLELNNRLGNYTDGPVPPKDSQGGFAFCPVCAASIRANGGHIDDGEGILVIEATLSATLHVDRKLFLGLPDDDKRAHLVEHLADLIHPDHYAMVDDRDGSTLDRYKVIEVRNGSDDCIATACKHCGGEGIEVAESGTGNEFERRIEYGGRGKPRVCPVCKGKKLLPGRPEEP